jgi:transposase
MTVQPHLSTDQLLPAARREPRPRVARRIQAVAMAQQLLTSAKIAQLTGDDQRSIRRWVKRYNRDGLVDAPRSGRPPTLPRDQEQAFKDRIAAGPTEDDLAAGVSVMHGKDYQRILENEFGKIYCLNGVYELLHRLSFSWLMPRPQHENADPQAQEYFKKAL